MQNKKGVINTIDLIAGIVIILGGVVTIADKVNLGVVLASIGLLIEALKILLKSGP